LRMLMNLTNESVFQETLATVRTEAEAENLKPLINWLDHKERNPWILQCLSLAMTGMSRKDWQTTRFNINPAESAPGHAYSQRDGIKLSLLAAVQRGKRIDEQFFQLEFGAYRFGINPRYGNTIFSGRKKLSATRKKAKVAKKASAPARELEKMAEIMGAAEVLKDHIIEQSWQSVGSGRIYPLD